MNQTSVIELRIASLEEKHVLTNLMQYYFYDFSEYLKFDVEDDGQYGKYKFLDNYWTDVDRFPYLVLCDGKLAGFVLVRYFDNSYHSIQEFFIMKKYRRQGLGKEIAHRIFTLHKGRWEVIQIESNKPAQQFWAKTIGEYTQSNYTNRTEDGKVIQEFIS